MKPRKQRPVFVVGCHRSGTNLLYDTLLSAGGFAMYHACPTVYETLLPYCGDLAVSRNREKLMQVWFRSKSFRRTGLGSEEIRSRILGECRSGGDFLRIIMGELARNGNVDRWAVYDPDNVLYIPAIKRDLPEALFVHIVRDGRDIALSLTRMRGLQPFWWDRSRNLFASALYWQWMVRKGRRYGRMFPDDYVEVHYEDLVNRPRETLGKLAVFLDHDLDYDRILGNGLGRVHEPNSTFPEEGHGSKFNPINRWKDKLSEPEIAALEKLVGECLQAFGYPLTNSSHDYLDPRLSLMRMLYPQYFETKLWLKTNTALGRFANIDVLELSEAH
jgi:Sulfotransferase family